MTVYIKQEDRRVVAWDGTDYKNKVFDEDDQGTNEKEFTGDNAVPFSLTLTKNTSQTLDLDGMDVHEVKFIHIRVDKLCKLKVYDADASTYYVGATGAGNGLPLEPPGSGLIASFTCNCGDIDNITLDFEEDANASDVNIQGVVCGADA